MERAICDCQLELEWNTRVHSGTRTHTSMCCFKWQRF
uniref:Uncharacterized protein n=1 Tax=Arundo donax TaxID=35708 RepID=A0A0A9BBA2_ARUDO